MIVPGDLLLVAGGWGVVRLACPGPWPFGLAGGLGLSFLAGAVALAVAVTCLAALGLPLWVAAPVLGSLAAAGLRGGRPLPDGATTAGAAGLVAAVLGARLVAAAVESRVVLNDEYAIWGLRGRALSLVDGLGSPVFTNAAAQYQHLDYPLLVPALVGWADRWGSGPLDGAAHAQLALLVAAMLGVVAWAVARLGGRLAALAAVPLAVAPADLTGLSQRLYGDPAAAAFGLATLLLLLVWLHDESDDRFLRLAAVMSAGALYTKNEGAVFALAALAGALVVARRRRPVALAAGAAVVAYLPWVAWTRLQDLQNDLVNGATLRPGRVVGNLDRLGPIWEAMSGGWPTGAWALVLVAPGALLAVRAGHGRLVATATVAVALSLAGLAASYVLTPLHLEGQLAVTVERVQLFPALVVLVSIPLFAGLAGRRASTRS